MTQISCRRGNEYDMNTFEPPNESSMESSLHIGELAIGIVVLVVCAPGPPAVRDCERICARAEAQC